MPEIKGLLRRPGLIDDDVKETIQAEEEFERYLKTNGVKIPSGISSNFKLIPYSSSISNKKFSAVLADFLIDTWGLGSTEDSEEMEDFLDYISIKNYDKSVTEEQLMNEFISFKDSKKVEKKTA
ncbi:MAG: hypothetical protein ABI721_02470 [Candidatus Dojkabacteria bacterium]